MKINIDEIQKITTFLLSRLKENKGNEIELVNDYYWDISDVELYNPYEEPKNITLGQLSEDFNEIQGILKSNEETVYDLRRIATILKAISVENSTAF